MEEEIYVVWKEEVRELDRDIGEILKSFFDGTVPAIERRRSREATLVYNRCGDGIFEVVEESKLIVPSAKLLLLRHWYEYDKDARINGEFLEYKVQWAIMLYRYEDNYDYRQWKVKDARVILYGRVPTKIRKLIEKVVEEMRQRVEK